MSKLKFVRARHALVQEILAQLDAQFLDSTHCYFGGGTRIVLDLNEYRESADIDMLCSSKSGYRELRSTVTNVSLGQIVSGDLALAREVTADRYGIRTFFDVRGEKIKFEIVSEGRIDVSGEVSETLLVPCLDQKSCFAEKFLANADRWGDESVLSRDVIDLAFMIQGWEKEAAIQGLVEAQAVYGKAAADDLHKSAASLLQKDDYRKRCAKELRITDTKTLVAGLKKLAAWSSVALTQQ